MSWWAESEKRRAAQRPGPRAVLDMGGARQDDREDPARWMGGNRRVLGKAAEGALTT